MKIPVACLAMLGLAACAVPTAPGGLAGARLPTEQFRAEVADEPHEIVLAIHASGLSPNQSAALAHFAADWHASGGAAIHIHVPAAGETAAARRFGEAVRHELFANGVPDGAMRLAGSHEAGVLRVGYLRRVAMVPECGVQWSDLRRTARNEVQPNFGCAVTANMAAQIADPSDLLGPRPSDPSDALRRGVVLDRYRQGQKTSAQVDAEADGAISNAVR
jgi:pilus assembly protein CpaD